MITTGLMPLIHREGLLKLINDGIKDVPSTSKDICPNVITSKQAWEQIQTHAGLGFFQNFAETEGVFYDTILKRHTKTYTPLLRSLGVKYSKQAQQKDLYGFIKTIAPMISDSAVATLNLLAANVLNLGFTGGGMLAPDGVALFSSAHTILQYGSTDTNYGTDTLCGLSLESAIQIAMSHKGDRGIPKYYRGGFNLIVGPLNAGLAKRAAESVGLQGTADNDTNSFVKGYIKRVIVDQLIGFGMTGANYRWFLVPADAKDNPIFQMQVQGLSTEMDRDIDHQISKLVATFETVIDVLGWRGLYGSMC